LRRPAAALAQEFNLCGGLHSFGQYPQMQALRQGNDGTHDGIVVKGQPDAIHKATIDFQ
jgi:hypothetical protein